MRTSEPASRRPTVSPRDVELVAHDPQWAAAALAESRALHAALGPVLLAVHHIGSTAIAGLRAKPVLDLMPVVTDLHALDRCRAAIEALGYAWRGKNGLPGRRYCTKSQPQTGRRLVHAHCYAQGASEITRHLAFRDYLRQAPAVAAAYDVEKDRCRCLHPDDSHAYFECKSDWVVRVEAQAVAWYGRAAPEDA